MLKPINKQKNDLFGWRVLKSQSSILRIGHSIFGHHLMLTNWRVLAIESFFELLGCSLTHGCLVIYGFTLLGHKTYNSFSVIGEDLVKHIFHYVFMLSKNGMSIAVTVLFFKTPCLNQGWAILDFYEEPFFLVLKN